MLKKFDEAIKFFEDAIKIDHKCVPAFINLGNIYQELDNYNVAIDYYEKAISLDPNSLRTYYNLGLLFGKQKKYNKAINCYENAIRINPNFKEPYVLYGNVLLNINKHKEGLEYIKKGCGFIKFNENNFSII